MGDGKIIYFPMRFGGKDWQTEQALDEKQLMCGWANSELYELIKKTYFKIKNNVNIVNLQNEFH